MPTKAQINANRNNARKSTGPRTEEGKARVSKNALKHGILARDTVLPGEDPADFDRQLAALEADIQPANSLEFELVRQIADAQWRMRRLTRLETGFLAAAVAEKRRLTEKYRPENLRPGYDGETLLLGSAILDRTQVLVHLARYDGHLSRRFFRTVKQLSDLRRDERKAREARSSAGSYTPTDPYCGRYVPAQAPPPIDTPSPTAGRIGFRASRESLPQTGLRSGRAPAPQTVLTKTTKQTQSRRTLVESSANCRSSYGGTAGQPGSRRRLCPATRKLSSSWRLHQSAPGNLLWRTLSACRVEALLDARGASTTNNQTNPISPNTCEINGF